MVAHPAINGELSGAGAAYTGLHNISPQMSAVAAAAVAAYGRTQVVLNTHTRTALCFFRGTKFFFLFLMNAAVIIVYSSDEAQDSSISLVIYVSKYTFFVIIKITLIDCLSIKSCLTLKYSPG